VSRARRKCTSCGSSAVRRHRWRLPAPAVTALALVVGLGGPETATLTRLATVLVAAAAGRVSGFSGCNRLVGSYAVENDVVTFSQLAGTMMACPEPAMALESAFRAALGGPLRFSIDAGRLNLKPVSGEPLVFAAEVQGLDGSWQVKGFNNGRDAVVGLAGETPVVLSFEKGAVSGDAGCNTFWGAYVVDGKSVKVGTLVVTGNACAADVMKQERELLAALESAVTWAVEDDTLDMHRTDGQRALMALRK